MLHIYMYIKHSLTFFCRYFSLDLPDSAKSAAARFRFWQPENQGVLLILTFGYMLDSI